MLVDRLDGCEVPDDVVGCSVLDADTLDCSVVPVE